MGLSRPFIGQFWRHRHLIWQMTRREVIGRYRGSALGLLWSFLNPVFMLAVYTFVFSLVFQARWGLAPGESRTDFAVILFAGLIVFNFFAEVLNRSPTLILGNVNYVKKVVFPLEVLPLISVGSALFHALISVGVLLIFQLFLRHDLPWTILLLPLVFIPLLLMTVGIAWFLSSLGVFLRDVSQTVGILTTALLFLSPVFFPASALPEPFRPLLFCNPLTFVIEEVRKVLIWGTLPDWRGWIVYFPLSAAVAWFGFSWFEKTRKGFADVL